MRSWVRMRSESTSAFGQPSETNPTLGADGVVTVDMANLGVKGARARSAGADWALAAPLIKKCAILAASGQDDQRLHENYDVRERQPGPARAWPIASPPTISRLHAVYRGGWPMLQRVKVTF
ncbi:hypothetical protein ALQ91_102252 [Pseudomonas syringae pv. syringae]|nr:hypothetical protein ALQ91_102252 [Pseudomonas syringae pv. syringae]